MIINEKLDPKPRDLIKLSSWSSHGANERSGGGGVH
jgi:hypothetical protein